LESIAQPLTKIKKRNPRNPRNLRMTSRSAKSPLGSWSAPGRFQRPGVSTVCAPLESIAQSLSKIKEKSA
jgi:hypothetical protein